MLLPTGYSEVPDGKLAAVVTCLEMRAVPVLRADRADAPWTLRQVPRPEVEWYRELFRRVGADWLWYSRLSMPTAELKSIIDSAEVEVHALEVAGVAEGLLELDFREPGECELAFFGVTGVVQGQGAGRWLMNRALERAWLRPLKRLWVHTCSLDHPEALGFYLRSGFRAYARRVEVADDPRLTGLLPDGVAAHVPLIAARPVRANETR